MDKTVKINLAGTLFQIETEAYYMLRDYLEAINTRLKNTPGGYEAMDDIESRIAEIFSSRKRLSAVISREDVRAITEIIGRPEDFDQSVNADENAGAGNYGRHLYRDPDNSIISGVCGGIGAYMNIDPVWIRLGFLVLTLFFGTGFFIYIGLWIALPSAINERMKRELYGSAYYAARIKNTGDRYAKGYSTAAKGVSSLARVLNEIFIALGRLLRIAVRIILIIAGVTLIFTAFSSLVVFIMVFYMRYPGYFFADSIKDSFFYMPDFLNLVISPALTPWVIVLTSLVVLLPLLALIYWGLKMIFYFRVRIMVFSIIALVMWVSALSALVMILFTQGISFAEQGKVVDLLKVPSASDTLYIKCDKKLTQADYDRKIGIPGENYSLYFTADQNRIFSEPEISFEESDKEFYEVRVEKIMHGRTEREAYEKAGALIFSYRVEGDTLFIDQYYEIPAGTKWSGSFVEVEVNMPHGRVIHMDDEVEKLTCGFPFRNDLYGEPDTKFWRMEQGELVSAVQVK